MPRRTEPAGLSSEQDGRALFRARGLRAKRSFGQCFLADANIARAIAREATTPPGGTTLEIGAGTGALTRPLLERAARVVAIERDRQLVPLLQESLGSWLTADRLRLVEADAVQCDWVGLLQQGPAPRIVAGNVPYQITGRLLEKAVSVAAHVDRVVFMVQREVAERVAATCGSKQYGALSVFVTRAYVVRRRLAVPASCFRPRPEVDSSVLVLERRQDQPVEPCDEAFEALVVAGFAQRRKTLRNAWRDVLELDAAQLHDIARSASIDLGARAETLPVTAFEAMAREVRARTR
ncbi:MAG: 16S rRNA (adenine(1518)-N(6)/adenine(1519)-N(6))-dimethyltransferase RsmA [Polyangiaceae bacterium]|jgi:16S rRNA (adenine1518-N6/adenine1519-N6)-dimethyltransferase|nr:16S rRNA (adenine(1518)-N(6)/adenine(1519)-N(6))-dimethyltransferase RsmA [Polyangiaceae bacterium]